MFILRFFETIREDFPGGIQEESLEISPNESLEEFSNDLKKKRKIVIIFADSTHIVAWMPVVR